MDKLTPEDLINKWILRVQRTQLAHRFAAKGTGKAHLLIGIPAAVLSTVVATSIFASWEAELFGYGRLITGMLSISSAILIALQTFLRLEELSDKHQKSDANYGTVRQKLEQEAAFLTESTIDLNVFCNEIRKDLDELAKSSPVVPERYWCKARSTITAVLK